MATVGEPDSNTGGHDSLDELSIKQIADASVRMRATARWTVGAVAALGTTLGGAITFTGLKDLDGGRFLNGAVGLGIVVLAAAIVIACTARVLAPTNIALPKAGEGLGGNPLQDMLLEASDLPGFATELKKAETALVEKLETDPQNAGIDALRRRAAIYGARAERIRLIAHFRELQRRWRVTLVAVLFCVPMTAVGVAINQSAASEQNLLDKAKARNQVLAAQARTRTAKLADAATARKEKVDDADKARKEKLEDAATARKQKLEDAATAREEKRTAAARRR